MKLPWTKSALESRSHAARTAAVADARAKLDAKRDADLAQLETAMSRVRERHRERADELDRILPARAAELDAELATSIRQALFPLAAKFATSPRAAAVEIASVWNAHVAAVRDTLNDEPSHRVIVAAFLHAAGGDDAIALLGSPDFAFRRGAAFVASIEEAKRQAQDSYRRAFTDVGPAEKERLFRVLETDVANAMGLGFVADRERVEAMLAHASHARAEAAAKALDKKRKDDAHAANIAARAAFEQTPEWAAHEQRKQAERDQLAQQNWRGIGGPALRL